MRCMQGTGAHFDPGGGGAGDGAEAGPGQGVGFH